MSAQKKPEIERVCSVTEAKNQFNALLNFVQTPDAVAVIESHGRPKGAIISFEELETLRKLLADQIKATERTNLVQSQNFREALEKAMLQYTNNQITSAEMIAQLLELAKWVREANESGKALGLSPEENAFYDALAANGSAKEAMQSDQLRLMARELAEMVKKMPKLDWTQRESVRADLRRKVRRLLAMYGYPPDLSEDATQLVLKQAELSTSVDE